jgi:hypothetical protein
MTKQASWTHGNSLTVETPPNLAAIIHYAWGTDLRFDPGQSSWCHIPIPTPVIIDDQRLHVRNLYLLYSVKEGEGSIRTILTYDGPHLMKTFDGLSLAGDHGHSVTAWNTLDMSNYGNVVAFGISISFLFQAAIDSPNPKPLLTITAAGADFFLGP